MTYDEYEKILKKINKNSKRKTEKLGIKTSALWYAAGIFVENNLVPGASQKTIYEMLKAIGKDERAKYKEQERIRQEQEGEKLDERI